MSKTRILLLSAVCALYALDAAPAFAADSAESLVTDGAFFGEMRYRYEHVDQEGFANNANASTIRTNLGFKTGIYSGFQGLIEGQIVQNIGVDNFNDTVNGKTAFPVVADPDVAEINELWLSYTGLPDTAIKLGRQKINLDNQRFVGTVGWRQNDQTFDALLLENTGIDNLKLLYSYIGNVNRIQGGDHDLGDLNSQIHIANASYVFSDALKLTAYGHWLDFDRTPTLSSRTWGARATGKIPLNEHWNFSYEAEAATQQNHANNAADYSERYYHIAPSVSGHGLTFAAGYEMLGGDGSNAFQTPLATLHKFNGWADMFLSTPGTGLEDTYGKISYTVNGLQKWADGTTLTGVYHNFDGDSGGDYGTEFDLSIGRNFTLPDNGQPFRNIDLLIKFADYNAEDAPYTDTQKIWLQISTKF